MKIKLAVKKHAELPAKKDDQPCTPQLPFFGHYPSPQFYPPPPFHFNIPHNPYFPYAQQFPYPLNYPPAGPAHLMGGPGPAHLMGGASQAHLMGGPGQTHLMGGPSQAHLMGGPAYPMMGNLPPAGLALPTGAHQPVLKHLHHGGLQPVKTAANPLGSTAAPCHQQPSGQDPRLLRGDHQPLSVRSDIHSGVSAQQGGGTAQVVVSAAVSSQHSGAVQTTSSSQSQVWVKVLSRNRGVYYYHNKLTSKNQWKVPDEFRI